MTDETQNDPIIGETREGKLARKHKLAMTGILEELRDAMELARADGFTTEFTIQLDHDGVYQIPPGFPAIIKRW